MSEALLGDPDDLRRILEALDARNETADAQVRAIESLAGTVEALALDVQQLRVAVDVRPTAATLQHKRRQVVASLIVYGLLIIWGHDAHVEHCGPGSRAEAVIRAIASADPRQQEPLTLERVQEIVSEQQPSFICDASFPFHAHDDEGFPGPGALFGFGLYAAGGTALYLWQRGPKRPPKGGRRSTDPKENGS